MQVWMITGDKQETAINIAIACKLVHHVQDLLIVNADASEAAARQRLEELLQHCHQHRSQNLRNGVLQVQCCFPSFGATEWR